jgi:hypothetical protein
MLERRISRRIASPLTLWILTLDEASDPIPAEMTDISARGMYFWSKGPLEIAAPVRMMLSLQMGRPETEPVVVVGEGKVLRLDAARADGQHGVAASVERYYVLEAGAKVSQKLQSLIAG